MILKYTTVSGTQFVVDDVSEVQAEYIDNRNWLLDAGINPDEHPSIVLTSFWARGEVRSIHGKPHNVFLMNDSGKTIDRY